ncbi:MAG: NAD(P)-dependent alcohol dehydrogenase, partial [Pseudomonadota bacterium]
GGPLDGVMAEYMCLSEQGVVRVPPHLSDEQAASLPCAGLTAWSALSECSSVKPGEKVLIQGSGGVALFALQFAKALGAHVTVISSSDEKIERLRMMGADAAINYVTVPEWAKASRAITDDLGFDHIVELGGEKTLPQSLRCIKPGGTISSIGVLSGGQLSAALGLIVTKQVRLQGVTVGPRDAFEAMVAAVDLHQIEPVVDRVMPFEDLKEAMLSLRKGAHFGKIAIRH